MIKPFRFMTPEEELYNLRINNVYNTRGSLICVHISDLHFGVIDPKYQYDSLKEQFLNKINDSYFNILSINGDIFDHKYMSNSDAVMYATLFISDCVNICKQKNATLILIDGTKEHDSGQLKLFYHYLDDPNIDIRIVEHTKFEFVKGAKILCIPEEYGKGAEYYNTFLQCSGLYDLVFMHGMLKGAIYQDKYDALDSNRAPTFVMEDFRLCKGCIISGHVHVPGCFEGYFYYCGSPYRWRFGEEQDKGFLVTLHNLDDGSHYVHFEKIYSHRYITINIDSLLNFTPESILEYLQKVKETDQIDYLRLEVLYCPSDVGLSNLEIIKKYFRNNNKVKIKEDYDKHYSTLQQNTEFLDKYKEYDFIMDKTLSEYEILAKYINQKKGYLYMTVDELQDLILNEV